MRADLASELGVEEFSGEDWGVSLRVIA